MYYEFPIFISIASSIRTRAVQHSLYGGNIARRLRWDFRQTAVSSSRCRLEGSPEFFREEEKKDVECRTWHRTWGESVSFLLFVIVWLFWYTCVECATTAWRNSNWEILTWNNLMGLAADPDVSRTVGVFFDMRLTAHHNWLRMSSSCQHPLPFTRVTRDNDSLHMRNEPG